MARLREHLLRSLKGEILGIVNKIVDKHDQFTQTEHERLLIAEAAFLACPSSIHSDDDGRGLTFNHQINSQLFYIASPAKTDVTESGIRKTADPFVLNKILDTVYNKKMDFALTQVLYKMSSEEENKETNKEFAKLDLIRATELKLKGRYSRWIDHQGDDLENFSKQSFDGEHRQFKQLLIARVDGYDRQTVEFNSTHLQTILRGHGVFTDVPFGGQLEALRASLASNEVVKNSVSKVMSNVAACMWPGINRVKRLDTEGILLGFSNLGGKANVPIYWNPENPAYNCKHLVMFGGSGKGKSTALQYWLWNATGANCNWILFEPKEDLGTSHLDMIQALEGVLIKIPDVSFNPFMCFYNPETQGHELNDRKNAFIRHKETLINFFNLIIGAAFSPAMSGTLKRVMRELYTDTGLVLKDSTPKNIEKWTIGEAWPSFTELIIKVDTWIDDPLHKKDKRSLEAIRGYLSLFEPGEALNFLDNHETFFPSAPKMVIDVSGILKRYQDPITVLLVDMISTRLKTPDPTAFKNKKRTIIAFDEGANLLKMAGMAEYIPQLLREARAGKCSIILDNQDPEGVKEILPILKTNTDAMVFFCSMNDTEIEEFKKHFSFTEKDIKVLKEKNKDPKEARQIYFVKHGLKLPVLVKLSNTQKRVIFNEDISEQVSGEMYSQANYTLEEGLEFIRDEEGVMSGDWISEMEDTEIQGFKRVGKFWPPSDDLSRVMWLDESRFTKEVIDGTALIGGESADHWITNALIAGELIRVGCTDVIIHHYGGQGTDDADVTCVTPEGKKLWIEYAHPGSRSIKELEQQKNHQMRFCDTWMCVCQKENEIDVKQAVGRDFYVLRGSEFRKLVENIRISKYKNINTTSGAKEALEA